MVFSDNLHMYIIVNYHKYICLMRRKWKFGCLIGRFVPITYPIWKHYVQYGYVFWLMYFLYTFLVKNTSCHSILASFFLLILEILVSAIYHQEGIGAMGWCSLWIGSTLVRIPTDVLDRALDEPWVNLSKIIFLVSNKSS